MYRTLIIATLLLGAPTAASSQTLQGRVTDAETNEPLRGATVFVPSLQLGTATDDQGLFQLNLVRVGTYRLVISFVGYQSTSRTVTLSNDDMTLNIELAHTTLEAPNITITAKAQASDILSTPQAVIVLQDRDLLHQQGAAAFDALAGVAGVRLLRTGPGIAKPVIRGLSSQRILVIQNGIRQEGQQWGDEHAPELDSFNMERIEVVKGPGSLLYGSDALGGIIQASSADLFAYQRPVETRVTTQGLSNTRQVATSLRLGGRTNQTVYDGTLTAKRAGSYKTPDGVVPNTGLTEFNGALRLGHTFSWGTAVADYEHFGATIGLFEPGNQDIDRFEIGEPKQRVSHDRAKLHLLTRLGGNRLEWVTTWQQNRRKEFEEGDEAEIGDTESPEIFKTTDNENEESLYLRLSTATSDIRFHHRPVGRMFGTVGVSGLFQRNETLAEETLVPGARTWNGSVYVFEELIFNQLSVSGGVRFDARRLDVKANEALGVITDQRRSYTAVTSALGFAWQPRSGLSLSANAGRAWRAPVLIELFGNGVHEGTIRFERGDASLRPEQSLTLDGTIRWLRPHAYLEVTAFVNQIENYIFPRRTGDTDPGSNYSIYRYEQAEARLWGGEAQVDLHPHEIEWLQLHMSGDIIWTQNLDTDDPLPWSPAPRIAIKAEVERKRMGPVEAFILRLGPTFTQGQSRIAPTETPTAGYTIWGASMSGELTMRAFTLTPLLAIENMFDERYISHLSRLKPFGVPNYGRNVRFELRMSF